MSYESGSLPKSPSGFDRQTPTQILPDKAFGSAGAPALMAVQENCSSHVIISTTTSGSLFFAVSSASSGTIAAATPLSASAAAGSLRNITYIPNLKITGSLTIPINANVWSGSGGTFLTGDVLFVFKGGL